MRQTDIIRELNDQFRCSFSGGRVVMTQGVGAFPPEQQTDVIRCVQQYDEFSADNDPHGEHDFGRIEIQGFAFFWKIDYYDAELNYGSENPADPNQTTRVLTIMLAEEY
jgi:hypothetical protein